MDGDEHAMI